MSKESNLTMKIMLILIILSIIYGFYNSINYIVNHKSSNNNISKETTQSELVNTDYITKTQNTMSKLTTESNQDRRVDSLTTESDLSNNESSNQVADLSFIKIGSDIAEIIKKLERDGVDYKVITNYVSYPKEGVTRFEVEGTIVTLYNDQAITSERVKWLQENLKVAGYYTRIDGVYNEETKQSLSRFLGEQMSMIYDTYNNEIAEMITHYNQNRYTASIDDYLVVVNKHKNLKSTDIPSRLVNITVAHSSNVKQVESATNAQLEKMFSDAKLAGVNLRVVSAYRSFDYQIALFERYLKQSGFEKANTFSALPGQSEHQTGLAVDLDDTTGQYTLQQSFDQTLAYQWLSQHAHQYGFILSFPKGWEARTGYMYEPWHYRYVGDPVIAQEIMERGMTLEEYIINR